MLRVRVHVVESNKWPPPEKVIWDKVVPEKDATKVESVLRTFATDPLLSGEMVGLRLKDGQGRGCDVQGALLGCEFRQDGETVVADVRFTDDKWRVW